MESGAVIVGFMLVILKERVNHVTKTQLGQTPRRLRGQQVVCFLGHITIKVEYLFPGATRIPRWLTHVSLGTAAATV